MLAWGRKWGIWEFMGSGVGACDSKQKVEHLNRRTVERRQKVEVRSKRKEVRCKMSTVQMKSRKQGPRLKHSGCFAV